MGFCCQKSKFPSDQFLFSANSSVRLEVSLETFRYAAIMLVAGIGIPMMAALNTQLGKGIGSPAAAATVLFTVAFLATAAVMCLTSGPAPLRLIPSQPIYLLFAGFGVVFYVLSVTWIAPRLCLGRLARTAFRHMSKLSRMLNPPRRVRSHAH